MSSATAAHFPGQIRGTAGSVPGAHVMTPARPRTEMRQHRNEDLSIIPGGDGWTQTIPTTANLGRSEMTKGTVIAYNIVRVPLIHYAGDLPYCVDMVNCNEDGEFISVTETDRTFGLPHMNTAHNQMLTDGVLKQTTRQIRFESYATDVAAMPTPHHYSTLVDLENSFFRETVENLWRDASSRMLRTLHLMVRQKMKIEFPTQWNLQKDEAENRRMLLGTYAAMNRFPREWTTAVYSSVVEGMSNRGFVLANGVAGNIFLVPRQACVEQFGDAVKEIKSLVAHESEDAYSLYHSFRIETGEVVGTATRSSPNFTVGRFTVVPYDEIQTGGDQLPDSFFERRLIPSSVVISRHTVSTIIPTPHGKTEHSPVDFGVSAGVILEDCCVRECKFHQPQNDPRDYYHDDMVGPGTEHNILVPSHAVPTVGGTWALQTDKGAAAMCGWLENVAKTFKTTDLKEIKAAIKRRTGFDATKLKPKQFICENPDESDNEDDNEEDNKKSKKDDDDEGDDERPRRRRPDDARRPGDMSPYDWMKKYMKYMLARLENGDALAQVICLLALLPCTRKIMTYLHELSPFTVCNFTLYISGWGNCADGYMMHPKPMTAVTSDNFVGQFYDPTKYGPKRWRIHSRVGIFRSATQPDLRITDIFITGVSCQMHTLSTARQLDRKSRIEDQDRVSDAFAVFSGVDTVFPAWCRFGPDSVAKLPMKSEIDALFRDNRESAKYMFEMLAETHWSSNHVSISGDVARECPFEQWVPWTASLVKADKTVQELEGMGQEKWR